MHAAIPLVAPRRAPTARRRPPVRRLALLVAFLVLVLAVTTLASTLAYLALPAPTGSLPVGRTTTLLTDASRPAAWSQAGGARSVPLTVWFPAVAGTGQATGYLPQYDTLRDGLQESGELDAVTVAGIGAVRVAARQGATPAGTEPLPLVILSPGNATNVAFYGALAEDLASHGHLVVGVDHPGQVTAVVAADGSVVPYRDAAGTTGPEPQEGSLAGRLDERTADIAFVLDRIRSDATVLPGLAGRIDPARIAVIGHSNGGLAAAAACRADAAIDACVNIDGQAAGGPFGPAEGDVAPAQPFLFLTKEPELHPVLAERFEAAGAGAYRVVVPGVAHGEFADGPRFAPRLLPLDGRADHLLTIERLVVRAFLDHALGDRSGPVFDGLAPDLDLYVDVYPLGGKAPLPAS